MYECVESLSQRDGLPIDLLICCGDFQSVRNYEDLACLACPPKYRELRTFYKYYTGEKRAPVLTIFIGGNHEASNYLVELYHGGWVAPNIYYLGYGNILNFGGLRIGGVSGIFNSRHYRQGHYEHPPFDPDAMRSVYHIREYEVWQMKQARRREEGGEEAAASSSASASSAPALGTSPPLDIFLSHDWPRNIAHHGNKAELLRRKKFLASEIADGSLGSPPAEELLQVLQPRYWFSAHMHVKFAAVVRHDSQQQNSAASSSSSSSTPSSPSAPATTHFLALDKCLPHREYMQVLDFPHATGPKVLCYDETWLAILKNTHPLLSLSRQAKPLPQPPRAGGQQSTAGLPRWDYRPTSEEISWIREHVGRALTSSPSSHLPIPLNFVQTAPGWHEGMGHDTRHQARQPPFNINPQTKAFLDMLQLPDLLTQAYTRQPQQMGGGYGQQQQHGFPGPFPQPPASSHSPSSVSLPASKKQRTFSPASSAAASATAPPLPANPDEIDLDALEQDDGASGQQEQTAATAMAASPPANSDEILLDEEPDDEGRMPGQQMDMQQEAQESGNPEEIQLDDI